MASKDNEPAVVSVTWDDQKKICNFGRLHKRELEVKEEVALLNQRLEHIDDAETEIYIADDIKFTLGESFVAMDTDEVDTLLNQTKDETEKQLGVLNGELDAIADVMKSLKADLYAKFGKAIYLETDQAE
eukprot:TRINITY_DN30281_c0_g1_i1.p1 TRINITY_DN30281_c0_g1~~TRINITY_DN30281_c0_g1_i1.p1  ORF type:complete len:143 (+),score=41.14 TRINITY_DN30281_c0_g1_i1:42-431(+)